jgi:hypothetical protein
MGTDNNHFANFLHLVAGTAHASLDTDKAWEVAEEAFEAYENGVTAPPVCGSCSKLATDSATSEDLAEGMGDDFATVYACDDHSRFMDGWLRDLEHETHCESMAARAQSMAELDYYSGRE